ncbi:MAG TPA: hypothetical protein VKU82_05110 [Planctomycetaceae bacterium]|nr:hypothetical protein [Planctomycetaceae bacterium]
MASKAFLSPNVERKIELAHQALELSPDCADAYVVLAHSVGDARQAHVLLEQALAAAERVLGPEKLAESAGHFWQISETRPYMRARLALCECLWSIGRLNEALHHLKEMLRLNPTDSQGVRYLLAAHFLQLGRDDEFDQLMEHYDEASTFVMFSKVLREFRRSGDSKAALSALARACRCNKHVVPCLLNGIPPSALIPNSFTPGHLDEAILYAVDFSGGWKQTSGAITWLRRAVTANPKPAKQALGPTAESKKRLVRLPQVYGSIWQATVTRVPTWLHVGRSLVRPWSTLVVDQTAHSILLQELAAQEPTAEMLFDCLARAMRKPLVGKSHRPSEIQVRDEPIWETLLPHLQEIGVDCIFRPELDAADYILTQMQDLMQPEGGTPGLTSAPKFSSPIGARFYEAAAAYFRRAPWQRLPSYAAIEVDCPQLKEFGAGRWHALALGQGGLALGLALYDRFSAIESVCSGCYSKSDRAPPESTGLSVIYSESFEIPIDDLLAAEQHHWELASPEAYPLVLCVDSGMNVRTSELWELQLLESVLRAIPDFVEQNPYASSLEAAASVSVVSANLKLALAWHNAEPAACGSACERA